MGGALDQRPEHLDVNPSLLLMLVGHPALWTSACHVTRYKLPFCSNIPNYNFTTKPSGLNFWFLVENAVTFHLPGGDDVV